MKKQEMQLEIAKAIAPTITYYWLSQIDYTPKRELPRNIAEDIAEQSRLIVDQLLKQD